MWRNRYEDESRWTTEELLAERHTLRRVLFDAGGQDRKTGLRTSTRRAVEWALGELDAELNEREVLTAFDLLIGTEGVPPMQWQLLALKLRHRIRLVALMESYGCPPQYEDGELWGVCLPDFDDKDAPMRICDDNSWRRNSGCGRR